MTTPYAGELPGGYSRTLRNSRPQNQFQQTSQLSKNRNCLMRGGYHDAYVTLTSQNLSYFTLAGTAVSRGGFASTTRFLRLVASGVPTATNGVRYAIGKAPAAVSTSTFLPINWVEYVQVPSGMQVSALGNDSTTCFRI
jgi:hypothetical protein